MDIVLKHQNTITFTINEYSRYLPQIESELILSHVLGIKREDGSLSYILLDGSGLTLAQARVHYDGTNTDLKAISKIKESSLPNFLAKALQRIYLIAPAGQPCNRTFFFKLCQEQSTNNIFKSMYWGPFTVFHIDYKIGGRQDMVSTVIFSQPWLGIKLSLQRVNRKLKIP